MSALNLDARVIVNSDRVMTLRQWMQLRDDEDEERVGEILVAVQTLEGGGFYEYVRGDGEKQCVEMFFGVAGRPYRA